MAAIEVAEPLVRKTTKRFYRPELDALRFFAFLAVLIHHGPTSSGLPDIFVRIGGYGLSMFFLLSAYLITELLIRERDQTGTVSWKLFFTRRALRIWPLYYATLLTAFVIGRTVGRHTFMPTSAAAAMAFFVANWFHHLEVGSIVGPLWSISVEEQFYAIWPPIVKFGGKKLAYCAAGVFIAGACIWISIFSTKGWRLWYDTPVEFLFFGAGVLIALTTHGADIGRTRGMVRGALLVAGLLCLVFAAQVGGVGTDEVKGITAFRAYLGYGGAMAGCALIFYAALGISRIPRSLIYLGKISYGLYVFHHAIFGLVEKFTKNLLTGLNPLLYMLVMDLVVLAFCIMAAHLSYRFLEKPFLKLKERFEVVHSRPA